MAYDYRKLCGRFVEKFGTQGRFAKAMGISERSLSLKLNGKVPFKQPEITKACELLEIEPTGIADYFFALGVQTD